ncbi:MAG TPA: DNA-3-methyladenine glycosylase 2 family protein [Alphaproteobacteria bacterium]|nr:DNA-3-methyladenine glycosylase 2 family protein [Alphaproteobacteria bacterium]
MPRYTKTALRRDIKSLAGVDPDMADTLARFGYPELRSREPGFEAVLRAIVGQQVSIAAAAAIWGRLAATVDPLDPATLLATSEEALRAAGLSRQKISYARGLAGDIGAGRITLEQLPRLADEEAIETLTMLKGIGRWTAEVYLLFALGRTDMFPADDLALMSAAGHMKGLAERPDRVGVLEIAEAWRPWRGAAAHMLWHYYHHVIMKPASRKADKTASQAAP